MSQFEYKGQIITASSERKWKFKDGSIVTASTAEEAKARYRVMSSLSLDKIVEMDYKDIPKKIGLNKRIEIDDGKYFGGDTVYISVVGVFPRGTDTCLVTHFNNKKDACEFLVKNKKELNELCKLYDKCFEKRKSFLNDYDFESMY